MHEADGRRPGPGWHCGVCVCAAVHVYEDVCEFVRRPTTCKHRRQDGLVIRLYTQASVSDRGLATPWTQLSPFIPVLCHHGESCPRPAMLSIQAVRGLPRLRAPGTVPCSDTTCRQMASVDSGFTCTVLSPDWGYRVEP